jgi:hypothetical protein
MSAIFTVVSEEICSGKAPGLAGTDKTVVENDDSTDMVRDFLRRHKTVEFGNESYEAGVPDFTSRFDLGRLRHRKNH